MRRNDSFAFRVFPALALFAALLLFVPAHPARAEVLTVTDPGDDPTNWAYKTGMFRTIVNNCRDGDEIRFADGAQTISLRGAVSISSGKTVMIAGPATITAQYSGSRLFVIPGGATAVMKDLTLSGAFPSGGSGGAVDNAGTLIMERCVLRNNRCRGNGGAIAADDGSATTLTDCVISGNTSLNASYSGGGVYVSNGVLTMTGCTVTNNTGALFGGGVAFSGTATLTNCVVESNATDIYGDGGGVHGNGTLSVSGGAVRNNSCGYLGGGFCITGGTATLTGCAVESNRASLSKSEGGGFYNDGAAATLVGCAVRNNTAGKRGGGVGGGGSLSLKSACTIAGNTPDNIYVYNGYASDGTNQIGSSPNRSATAFSGYSGASEPEPRSITGDADVAKVKNALTDPTSDVFRAVSGALSNDLGGVSGDATASLAGMTASLYYANTFEGVAVTRTDLVVEYTASYPERARYYALFARADGWGYELPTRGVQFELKAGQSLPDGVTPPDFYEEGEGLMTWRDVVTDNGSYDLEPAVGVVTFRVCSVRAAETAVGDTGSGGGCNAGAAAGSLPLALLLVLPLASFAGRRNIRR
jgi:predicted outer membrane repeat protein